MAKFWASISNWGWPEVINHQDDSQMTVVSPQAAREFTYQFQAPEAFDAASKEAHLWSQRQLQQSLEWEWVIWAREDGTWKTLIPLYTLCWDPRNKVYFESGTCSQWRVTGTSDSVEVCNGWPHHVCNPAILSNQAIQEIQEPSSRRLSKPQKHGDVINATVGHFG